MCKCKKYRKTYFSALQLEFHPSNLQYFFNADLLPSETQILIEQPFEKTLIELLTTFVLPTSNHQCHGHYFRKKANIKLGADS